MLSKHPPTNPVPYQGKLTIANAITDVTRLAGVEGDGAEYPDSSVGVWPAATNRNVNGNATTNTTGVTDNSSTTSRATSGTVKFGATAFGVVSGNATANEGPSQAISGGAAATVYTVSAWAWLVSGAATVRVALYDSVSGKQGGTPVALTTTPVRITVTATTGAASTGHASYVETTAQQAGTWRIGGWQVETGAIATPYIEADGGTASRGAGRIQMPAGALDETQMWFATRVRMGYTKTSGSSPPNSSTLAMFFSWADSGSVYIAMYHGASGAFRIDRKNGGATAGVNVAGTTWTIGDSILVIGYWTATGFGLSLNGAAFGTASGTSIPALSATTADIASGGTTWTAPADGSVLWYAAGLGTLTDADAALFNAWGNNDPLPHMFPKSAQLSFLDPFNGDGTFYRRSA